MPATRELGGAQAWMHNHTKAGVEGVVVKHREHGYRPRRRCWWKVRTRTTADAVVGGVLGPLDAPEALLLGLPDDNGRLRVAGRTGPLTLPARRELGALLIPAQRTHPWPERIPLSRFGQLPGT
jgi:ATP-dependent DNA ligase